MQLGFLKKLFATRSFSLMNEDSIYGRPEVKEELYEERESIYRQVAGQRGNNITITLAVSSTFGLIYHSTHIGGTNQARFQAFLQECAENLPENEIYFRWRTTSSPAAQTPTEHIELRILPPYSPFLNIVENAISALKAAIKGDISRPMVQQQMNDMLTAQQENISVGRI